MLWFYHIFLPRYPLGRLLFESFCREHDDDALEEWLVQEDDFAALAARSFQQVRNLFKDVCKIVFDWCLCAFSILLVVA